jgi:hypothetical protein
MSTVRFTEEVKANIRLALEQSWSAKTSLCFHQDAPLSYGQCAPTAIVLFEKFGGEILRTEVRKKNGDVIRHFYNLIEGDRHDFTADQFNIPDYFEEVIYRDILSSVEEASTEMVEDQLEAMREAFSIATARLR